MGRGFGVVMPKSVSDVWFFLIQVSFDISEYTAEVDAVGTLRILDAIRTCGLEKEVRFYQASTSELYGKVQEIPQKETTPFYPRSPYGNWNKIFPFI